jgi:tetratricopeptide (TPR) repeat protein
MEQGLNKSYLEAAEAWLTLGNYLEANEELERISPTLRAHPDVLEMRCRVYEAAGHWEANLMIARTLAEQMPHRPSGILHTARCLHRLSRTEEAYDLLAGAARYFPSHSALHYDLAVYATRLGHLDVAKQSLKIVFENDPDGAHRIKALDDLELSDLWQEFDRT